MDKADQMQTALAAAGARHNHVCPRIVLGVRMALLAEEQLGLKLPQHNKRLLTIVETDGCFSDGIAVVTGCELGHRTLRLVDYGRVAATFIDTKTLRALRVAPHNESRTRALDFVPAGRSRWHRYLEAYQIMPDEVLLTVTPVTLTFSLEALLSKPGARTRCECCGEEIINEREVVVNDETLCRACAYGAYYTPDADGLKNEQTDIIGYELP